MMTIIVMSIIHLHTKQDYVIIRAETNTRFVWIFAQLHMYRIFEYQGSNQMYSE